MKKGILLVCLTIIFISKSTAQIVYVNASASGANNGNSWNNAFTTLQAGINAAQSGAQIWVASGTYITANYGFVMKNNVGIYGGFNGTETALSQRDWNTNISIMKGGGNYPVVLNNGNSNNPITGTAILDGFTITNGNANSSYSFPNGGGIFNQLASPTLRNLIITDNKASNKGGGIYGIYCASIIENVTISNNDAIFGGGIYFEGGTYIDDELTFPSLYKATIESNKANNAGAGIYLNMCQLPIIFCSVRSNTTIGDGGGIFAKLSTQGQWSMANCVIADNVAGLGGGMYMEGTATANLQNITVSNNVAKNSTVGGIAAKKMTFYMSNSIVYGNKKPLSAPASNNPDMIIENTFEYFSNCNISGYASAINFDIDPEFIDPDNGDYQLSGSSPIVNAGNNSLYTSLESVDIAGNPRIFYNTIDLGAYEFQSYVSIKKHEKNTALHIYPNPAKGQVTIELPNTVASLEVIISDVNGKVIQNSKIQNAFSETIDLNNWSPGVYFIKTTSPYYQTFNKLVVIE